MASPGNPSTSSAVADDDKWHRIHSLYYREQTRALQALVTPGSSVLELGCGTGETLAALQPSRAVGVDRNPDMLAAARERHPGTTFVEQDIHALDLDGQTFDFVLLADLVGELNDLWAAFRALRKVMHPRSRVIITYYNFLWQPALEVAQALHLKRSQALQNWFSLSDMANLLALNGFETVTTGSKLLFPLDVMGLEAVANKTLSGLPGVQQLNLMEYLVARPGPAFDVVPAELSVTVVIPAKNEKGNIRPAIRRTPKMGTATEIIFVEGGSKDGTREEILQAIQDEPSECSLRFIPQTGKGKANAVHTAFAEAKGDILMILDADLTVLPEDLPRFYLAIAEKRAEFVTGSRLVYQMEDQAMRHLNLAANKAFGVAFSHVLGQRIKDTLCGTKVMLKTDYVRIMKAKEVFGDFDPFGDFELLFGAARLGLRIVEIPVRYKARTYGSTQIHRFRHGLLLLKMLGVGARYFKS